MKFCHPLAFQIHASVSRILYLPFTFYSIFDTSRGGEGGFKKSRRSRNSRELAVYFSLEITIIKDVCVLFKHSHFCFRMLEMHSKRLRFQNFSRNSRLCREFFHSPSTLNFCHLLKILWKTLGWGEGVY